MPRIRDVDTMLELLSSLGADAEWTGQNEVRVHAQNISPEVDARLASRIRASFLLAGPLLARLGSASVPPPGGDVIGRRRLDPHIHAFAELGATFEYPGRYELSGRLSGAHIHMDEASVMATENAVMAASIAPGNDDDLERRLRAARAGSLPLPRLARREDRGDRLERPPHRRGRGPVGRLALRSGRSTSRWAASSAWRPSPAATSRSKASSPTTSGRSSRCSSRLGVEVELGDDWVRVPPYQTLEIRDDLGGAIPKIEDGPWPAFPADLTSIAVVVATQARGTVLIFEKMFESRLFFVDKLVSMGARIILCDPHRVVVTGPAPLYGQRMSSPDIRAGMAMVIAALCAEGTSTIGDAYQIDKGYERIDERLRALGAQIERVEA